MDAETGNVYVQGTQGLLSCFSAGRQGAVAALADGGIRAADFPKRAHGVAGDRPGLVITRGITSGWGAHGPAGDRFYAFDKKTGELVWSSVAGGPAAGQHVLAAVVSLARRQARALHRRAATRRSRASMRALANRSSASRWRRRARRAASMRAVLRYKDNAHRRPRVGELDTSEVGRTAAFKIPTRTNSRRQHRPPRYRRASAFLAEGTGTMAQPARQPRAVRRASSATAFMKSRGTGELAAVECRTPAKLVEEEARRRAAAVVAVLRGRKTLRRILHRRAGEATASGRRQRGGNGELFIFKPGEKDAEVLSRRCSRPLLRLARRLQRQALRADRQEALLLWQERATTPARRPRVRRTKAGPKRPAPPAKLPVIPNEVAAQARREPQAARARARCERLHRRGERRSEVGEMGDLHPADRAREGDDERRVQRGRPAHRRESDDAERGRVHGQRSKSATRRSAARSAAACSSTCRSSRTSRRLELKEMTGPGIGNEAAAARRPPSRTSPRRSPARRIGT